MPKQKVPSTKSAVRAPVARTVRKRPDRQRSQASPFHPLHRRRAAWVGILLVGLLFINAAYNLRVSGQPRVLGESTTISSAGLLASTNQARTSAGLPTLTLNNALSRAAMAKARDMVTRNYWAHTAPEGTTPWQFIARAGYSYQAAGENLAYGFATDNQTISAWLQSPEHRANMLGAYHDVGFGYASSSDYQGANATVVVALYGEPAKTTTAATMAANTSAPRSSDVIRPNALALLMNGGATWAVYASLALIAAAAIGFITTHLELMRLGWYRARKFVLLHPAVDALVVVACLALLLHGTSGFIN